MHRSPDRVIATLVRALLPSEPAMPPDARRRVELATIAFVDDQSQAMPRHLTFGLRLAFVALNWLAVLRYGRTFVALDPPARREYVGSWAGSRFAPARDIVRLVRSSALFQFYDHATVRDHLESDGETGA